MISKIEKFEDIVVWQRAKELTFDIYRCFRDCRDYDFKSQIQRAVVSIMNNIAEGYERKTNKEFVNFLFISKGSSAEVRSMLVLAKDLDYVSMPDYQRLHQLASTESKMLSNFIKYLKINSYP